MQLNSPSHKQGWPLSSSLLDTVTLQCRDICGRQLLGMTQIVLGNILSVKPTHAHTAALAGWFAHILV